MVLGDGKYAYIWINDTQYSRKRQLLMTPGEDMEGAVHVVATSLHRLARTPFAQEVGVSL